MQAGGRQAAARSSAAAATAAERTAGRMRRRWPGAHTLPPPCTPCTAACTGCLPGTRPPPPPRTSAP